MRIVGTITGLILMVGMISTSHAQSGGGGASPYLSLSPALVVNVIDGSRVRHMQVDIQLKVDSPETAAQMQAHTPAIRHEMVMLLSGREVSVITTPQGKEQLRQEALEAVQKTMKELAGSKIVDGLYFTSFIIQ